MTVHFTSGNSLDKAPPFRNYAILLGTKSEGADGGTFTANQWQVRDLDTEYYDPDGIVTLSNNIFVLTPGNYKVVFSATAHRVETHKCVLLENQEHKLFLHMAVLNVLLTKVIEVWVFGEEILLEQLIYK